MNGKLLKKHIQLSPRMEITDAVKLIFQSEFGCGHLFNDLTGCADWIRREMAEAGEDAGMEPATYIGGGMARLNLASPDTAKLPPELIARMMQVSSQQQKSSTERFEESLSLLAALADAGETPFSADALMAYLADYKEAGYPVVSHSQRYRAAYQPAYRVVMSDFAVLLPALIAIEEALKENKNPAVVIDGDCGAGKTTLAALLACLYDTKPIQMDDFFLPFEMRTKERMMQAGGNVHYERFASEVLCGMAQHEPFTYQAFDCQSGMMHAKQYIPIGVTLIEGSYSHHPYFDEAYKKLDVIKVFVWVDEAEQQRRLTNRNPLMLERFQNQWIPLEKKYFKAYDMKARANFALRSVTWEDEE
ncbi:MAG: hypothetical protein GX096_07235 [Clostridiales bacterium]|nr:hypothetical protein [Clostridiales bacterium]